MSKMHVIMKNDIEIVGTLVGFDDYVSILANAVVEQNYVLSLSVYLVALTSSYYDC